MTLTEINTQNTENTQLTDFERGRIIGRWEAGQTTREIANAVGRTQTQVQRAIKAYREKGQITVLSRSGRPKSLTDRDSRTLKRIVIKNRFTPAREITNILNETTDNPICDRTIRNYLHEEGYYSRAALRKPFVSEVNRKKRFSWCRERKNWNVDDWSNIIWSDESKFNLHHSDGRQRVWRVPKEKYDVDCLIPTFKHGGGGIMVWGCFVNNQPGPLVILEAKITGKKYQELLENYLLPFMNELGTDLNIFQDDNAPVHTAKAVLKWKEDNLISSLPWPAQSPDLNPIEHVWDYLEKAVHNRKPHPKNIEELSIYLNEEWGKLDRNFLQNLVNSMPRRVAAVINSKGNPTKY